MQERVRARYDYIAKWHDAAGFLVTPHRREAVRALHAQQGDYILDLACGTGINFRAVLKRLGTDGRLLGIDYSTGMLEQARRRVMQAHWGNAILFLSDAARLPFADNSFDRVICSYALRVIPPYRQALDEVVRILKSNGVFVVLDGKLSIGKTRFLNPLIVQMSHSSLSDFARPLIDEIAQRFRDVQIHEYGLGHVFVAVAHKK